MSSVPPRGRINAPWLGVIILAQAAWLGWFLVVPLPNTGADQVRRFVPLIRALPHVVPGVRWGDSYLGQAWANLSHVENLAERGPIVLASSLIAGAALAVGSVILRGLGWWVGLAGAERVALGFGVGTTALGVGTLILGRTIGLDPSAVQVALGGLIGVGMVVGVLAAWRRGAPDQPKAVALDHPSIGQVMGWVVIVGPFLVLMGLGAMLPTIEFDSLEYHLQGPKEFFLDGWIRFLPHNVYTSMPFGVEMLHLLAMEVLGDWWRGALAGQELVAWFAPAAAVLIAATATRISGSRWAGWFAAVVYLTTPWVGRVAVTPFVEGPLCFGHAALVWAVVRLGRPVGSAEATDRAPTPLRSGLLVGLLAGGAMAIKYPALVSAVVPAGLLALIQAGRVRSIRPALGFVVGVALVVAPWLGKNVIDTGNPVYPLGWSVLGGTEWDAARDAQWRSAHGPRPVALGLLIEAVVDVAGRSDWQSPLYGALAPLAWVGARGRRTASALAIYAGYLFVTWWLLTHRLDRFWLPMLPVLAILAGLGADALRGSSRVALGWLALVLALAIGSNATLCSTELVGPTAWTGALAQVRAETARAGTPGLAELDRALPPDARPLVIGQAGVFGLRHRPVYNTVFNRDIFEAIARDLPPRAVHRALVERGITHVYVDWAEIDRYRQPGNYGFTDFETPRVFDALVESGVLDLGSPIGSRQVLHPVRRLEP